METLATRARSATSKYTSICSRISFGTPLMVSFVPWHSLSSGWMRSASASESRGVVCPAFMDALVGLLGFPFGGLGGCGCLWTDKAGWSEEGRGRFVKRKGNLT
ncbi:unnamed protein product [Tuber melanosporum]|uniref:(Perigord truffle) hypothetical protein n=1 Tax=Tuber melanosporum (strain Mel28) TaxID=656061 RepID=D5G8W3_TUBMM|nr:uncharacterized protein GSTUM_00004866001 [Tuber melanosporum]CAZ80956.1 unnamed protein product [Tuber melanosporum]